MRKRVVLTSVALTLIVAGIIVFFVNRGAKQTEPIALPKPNISNYLEEIPITSNIEQGSFDVPTSAPLMSVQRGSLSESKILEIAQKLGFGQNYKTGNDTRKGRVYVFTTETDSLVAFLSSGEITYTTRKDFPAQNKQLSDTALTSTAKDFIENYFSPANSLSFSFVTYLDSADEHSQIVERDLANIYKVNFSPVRSEYRLVQENPTSSGITAWLANDGEIFKVEYKHFETATLSSEKHPLKNYGEFLTTLNEASLVSLDDGNIFPNDLPKDTIQSITVNRVELAYLQESGKVVYQPIFLLSGVAETTDGDSLSATLYLPALK